MYKEKIDTDKLPQHVAITMDGNGRWAKSKGKFRVFGHQSGVKAVRDTVKLLNWHFLKNVSSKYISGIHRTHCTLRRSALRLPGAGSIQYFMRTPRLR